ncbi:MAG: response regulator [Candidatus Omnitrophota bacterium]
MKKILIVDDEENLRELYRVELMDEGFEVITAKNGFEGVEKCENENPDLVIVDIRMPGMDGLETISRILNLNRKRPIIIHSAYPHYQDNFLSWNADAFVVKSSNMEELKCRVNDCLASFNSN